MRSPQHIALVVTTYNRSDALLAVLNALERQTDRDFDVVVADDGSCDAQVNALLESPIAARLKVQHVWHPDVGFTASRVRNRGVAASMGDYIVFLDGDCVPEVDFIAQHRRLAEPGCLLNGSRVLLSPGLTTLVLDGHESLINRSFWCWLRWRFSGQASKISGCLRLPDSTQRVEGQFRWKGIRSCNMGVWRSDFMLVNGFDESFFGWGHEDADFVLRLHNAGVQRKNGYCATEVFHLWHQESSRVRESQNATTVRRRMETGETQPLEGFTNSFGGLDVVVRKLG